MFWYWVLCTCNFTTSKAVQSFNEVTAKIQKENSSLEETIKVSKKLLSSKDKPLDENLTVELKNEVSTAEKKKQIIPKNQKENKRHQ